MVLFRQKFISLIVTLAVFFLYSCAYHPELVPIIKIPSFYDYKVESDDMDVVVDPYVAPSKVEYMFNVDMIKKGVLPLHIIIWNKGIDALDLSSVQIQLRSFSGEIYQPLSDGQISKKIFKNTFARMVSFGAVGSAFIFFTVPFAVGAGIDSYQANKKIKSDLNEKSFKQGVIEQQALFQGFLFFDLGSKEYFEEPFRLLIENIQTVGSEEAFNVEVPFVIK